MFLHIVLHFQTLKLSQAECKIALHSKSKIMQKLFFHLTLSKYEFVKSQKINLMTKLQNPLFQNHK